MNNYLITIQHYNPFSQYHPSKKVSASSLVVRVEVVGMIYISDPRWSVKVMIVSNPLLTGRGPMKSMGSGPSCHEQDGRDFLGCV